MDGWMDGCPLSVSSYIHSLKVVCKSTCGAESNNLLHVNTFVFFSPPHLCFSPSGLKLGHGSRFGCKHHSWICGCDFKYDPNLGFGMGGMER